MILFWRSLEMCQIEFEILDQIEQESSSLKKRELFKQFCSKDGNLKFIYFAYNNVKYNIAKITLEKAIRERDSIDNSWFAQEKDIKEIYDDMNYLSDFSGTEQFRKIIGAFTSLNKEQTKWFKRAILHDLQMGFAIKQINKVLKELNLKNVEYHLPPQLCGVIKVDNQRNILFPKDFPSEVGVEEKMDGVRVDIIKEDKLISIISRNGKKYHNFQTIENAINKLPYKNIRLDCEIIAVGEGNAMENYQQLTKILQRKQFTNINNINIRCIVFDVIEIDDKELYDVTQKERRKILEEIKLIEPLVLSKMYVTNDKNNIQKIFDDIISKGGEGIVIKYLDKPYDFDSRNNWWKVKPYEDQTFVVTNYGYGDGKSNQINVAYLEIEVNGKFNRVGSGFDDNIIRWMTENTGALIGSKIDVRYTGYTKDGLLRFPRFLRFRNLE